MNEQQTEIEIKSVEAKNLAISTKMTLYIATYWISGNVFTSTCFTKFDAERYLHRMTADHKEIYKIEIDVPYEKTDCR